MHTAQGISLAHHEAVGIRRRYALLISARRQYAWPRQASAIAAVAAQLLGLGVFAGWWLGIARIVQPIPGSPEMVQDTAFCFILLGTSLLLLQQGHGELLWQRLAQMFALVAVALATVTLGEYVTGLDL